MWGAEAQGTQQLLLWHKGAEGTPFWRVSQAAGAGGWVGCKCSTARGPVKGPRRLHSYLQNWGEGIRSKTEKEEKGEKRES